MGLQSRLQIVNSQKRQNRLGEELHILARHCLRALREQEMSVETYEAAGRHIEAGKSAAQVIKEMGLRK